MGNDQQRGYPGGYYTQIPSGAPPPVAQPNRSTTPPASSSTLASRPPSYGYQPPVPSGSAPAPAPAYYNPSYQYYEDDSASRSREERASAMSARVAKYKVKKRVSDQSKAANWKKYDDLGKTGEQQQQGKPAAVGVGYRLADSMKVSGGNFHPNNNAPNASAAAAAAVSKNPPEHKKAPSELSDDDFFEQQIATMSEKVRKMPIASVILLKKILANVLKTPEISTSSSSGSASAAAEDPMKFRRLKLGSEKIMKEIINVDGALQLLFGVGFDEGVWNGEKVLTFHLKTPTDLVEVALEQLNELFPDTKTQAASANVTPTSSTTTLKKLPLSK